MSHREQSYNPAGINYMGFDESNLPPRPKGRSGVKSLPIVVARIVASGNSRPKVQNRKSYKVGD